MSGFPIRIVIASVGLLLTCCVPKAPIPPGDISPPVPPVEAGEYVGLPKNRALARARAAGAHWRVVEEDGRPLPSAGDHQADRLNFTIREGVVVEVTRG